MSNKSTTSVWVTHPSLPSPSLQAQLWIAEHCVTTPDECIIDKTHITAQKIIVTIESRCFCGAMRGQRLVFLWYSIKGLGTNNNCCQNIKVWQSIKPFTGIIAEMKFFIGFQKSCSFLMAPLEFHKENKIVRTKCFIMTLPKFLKVFNHILCKKIRKQNSEHKVIHDPF